MNELVIFLDSVVNVVVLILGFKNDPEPASTQTLLEEWGKRQLFWSKLILILVGHAVPVLFPMNKVKVLQYRRIDMKT